jgi:hypothetical protein
MDCDHDRQRYLQAEQNPNLDQELLLSRRPLPGQEESPDRKVNQNYHCDDCQIFHFPPPPLNLSLYL